MWAKLKDRVPGIAENAVWDAIKWLLRVLLVAIVPIVVGWIKGVSGMVLLDIFVVVFVSVLFLMIFVQIRRMGSQPPSVDADQQSQTTMPEIQPLKNAPYLSSTGHGAIFSSHFDDEGEKVELAELWTLSVTNDLFSSDVGAADATGICVEITYYDAKWQRLFGPIQGGWTVNRGGRGDSETYLNTDPIMLGPQETHNLAVVIRMSKDGPFFALGKESLPFFCWRNPAFELDNYCRLQVVLKGDAVQRTFYFQLRCGEEGQIKVGQILLPEK